MPIAPYKSSSPKGEMTTHIVESTRETVRSGYLDPTAEPVAVVESGDTVSYLHTWTHWGNEAVFGMSFAEREPLRHRYPHGPYSMLGPVEVPGAMAGDVVECTLTAHLRELIRAEALKILAHNRIRIRRELRWQRLIRWWISQSWPICALSNRNDVPG
jgi:hypothetical protein